MCDIPQVIKSCLPNGDTLKTSIEDGLATDVVTQGNPSAGLGPTITIMKPRPLTEVERWLGYRDADYLRLGQK